MCSLSKLSGNTCHAFVLSHVVASMATQLTVTLLNCYINTPITPPTQVNEISGSRTGSGEEHTSTASKAAKTEVSGLESTLLLIW